MRNVGAFAGAQPDRPAAARDIDRAPGNENAEYALDRAGEEPRAAHRDQRKRTLDLEALQQLALRIDEERAAVEDELAALIDDEAIDADRRLRAQPQARLAGKQGPEPRSGRRPHRLIEKY